MAQARYQKLGTIFSRINGLIRGGAMNFEDRPLWYDIYEKFPPRAIPQKIEEVPQIMYPEDYIRAYYYDNIGQNGVINMLDTTTPTICQKYVEKYCEILKTSEESDTHIFDKAKDALVAQGTLKDKKYFFKNVN